MPCPHLPEGFDATDPDLLRTRVPLPEFAELRQTAPVWWCPQPAGGRYEVSARCWRSS